MVKITGRQNCQRQSWSPADVRWHGRLTYLGSTIELPPQLTNDNEEYVWVVQFPWGVREARDVVVSLGALVPFGVCTGAGSSVKFLDLRVFPLPDVYEAKPIQ
jgi:hypothetical protein